MGQCTAKAKQSGARCRKDAIPGGAVCKFHGGGAPQVKKKARERLNDLVDPAINVLQALLDPHQTADERTKLAAAKDALDRAGLKAPEKVDHDGTLTIKWKD